MNAGPEQERVEGYFVLDKAAGISSAAALNAIKRGLPRKTKVGHAGTLDPFATGVLVVLIGRGTKMCERVMGLPKSYDATIRFGETTRTLDPESPVISGPTPADLTPERLRDELGTMVGEIDQLPPSFSAVKVQGRRAYDLARQEKDLELQPRRVTLYEADVLGVKDLEVTVRIRSGRGFYVRSLARDLAARLDTVGHLTALRRTAVGPFAAEQASEVFDASRILPLSFLERA